MHRLEEIRERFNKRNHNDGGPGSGNFGHAGVPGQKGGSAPAGGGAVGGASSMDDITKALGGYEFSDVYAKISEGKFKYPEDFGDDSTYKYKIEFAGDKEVIEFADDLLDHNLGKVDYPSEDMSEDERDKFVWGMEDAIKATKEQMNRLGDSTVCSVDGNFYEMDQYVDDIDNDYMNYYKEWS